MNFKIILYKELKKFKNNLSKKYLKLIHSLISNTKILYIYRLKIKLLNEYLNTNEIHII